jgi:hypothetical protein
MPHVATLLLEEWEDDSHTPEMGTWESTRSPQVRAVVSLVSPKLLVACPNTKGAPESELIECRFK